MPFEQRFGGRRLDRQKRRPALAAAGRQLALVLLPPPVPPERLDHELHPVALLVLVVAEPVEHAQDGFGHAEQVRGRDEFVQDTGRLAHDGGAAARHDPEAPRSAGTQLGEESEVVDRRRDVILRAPFEGDLELARQRGAEPMTQEEPRQRFGVWRDVEPLGGRDARVRARGDVAHGIAARLARREPRLGEAPHRRLDVVQLDEMKLDVLARGDVAEAPRIALADVGERRELIARQDALRHLDAQHLRVGGLALPVRAANEPERAPLVGRQLAALVALERRDEFVDVGHAGEREARAAVRAGVVA